MTKKLLITISAFCFLQFASAQQYGWVDISSNLPDYPFDTTIINGGADTIIAFISDICFINDNEGWVSTSHGFSEDSAAILHTTNGGDTWEVQMIFRPCSVIHMLNENEGWAGSDHGLIFRTTDGGKHWNIMGATGGNITGISFVPGSDTGYVSTYDNTSMHQVYPGGVTTLNLGFPAWWVSISASSRDLIWLSAANSVWTYEDGVMTDQPVTSDTYNNICFLKNDLGWGCGYHGVKERNEGTLMGCVGKNIPWVVLTYTDLPMNKVFALDENHLWAVGFGGQIYYSENASDFGFNQQTSTGWSNVIFTRQEHPLPDLDLWVVFFSSVNNGYASGGNNTLLKYTQTTGMRELQEEDATIWPNPARDKCKVRSAKYNIEEVELMDLFGNFLTIRNNRIIGQSSNRTVEFNIGELPPGIYIVRISTLDNFIVRKLIKL